MNRPDSCLRAPARDAREAKPKHTRRWLAVLRERRRVAAQNRRRLRGRFVKYLHLLANGDGARAALKQAGLTWTEMNRWFGRQPKFRQRIARAKLCGELLRQLVREDEAHRRAVVGVKVPLVSCGVHVLGPDGKPLYRTRYSDRLLLKLAARDHPERFTYPNKATTPAPDELADVLRRIEGVS